MVKAPLFPFPIPSGPPDLSKGQEQVSGQGAANTTYQAPSPDKVVDDEEGKLEQEYLTQVHKKEHIVLSEDVEPESEPNNDNRGYAKGCSNYYNSHVGLSQGELHPLFLYPVELVANSRAFVYWNGSIIGQYRLRSVPGLMPRDTTAGMTALQRMAIDAERTTKWFLNPESDIQDSDRQKYFDNLRVLQFQRATFDALMFGYQQVVNDSKRQARLGKDVEFRLNADTRRAIGRFVRRLCVDPVGAAKEIKVQAGHCRAWHYGAGRKPKHPLVRQFTTTFQGLTFSYSGRALPPPSEKTAQAEIQELKRVFTQQPRTVVPWWRPFCREYFMKYMPKGNPDSWNYSTTSSVGGSFGYNRSDGGFQAAVHDLMALGFCLTSLAQDPTAPARYRGWGNHDLGGQRAGDLRSFSFLAETHGPVLQKNLEVATLWVLDLIKLIPVQVLAATERGLKTRTPTKSLAAASLVHQLMRSAADAHHMLDPRASISVGGHLDVDLTRQKGPWYSQDLSGATNEHDHWLTQGYYEELLDFHPRLEKYRRFTTKLFGPRKLLERGIKPPPRPEDPDMQWMWTGTGALRDFVAPFRGGPPIVAKPPSPSAASCRAYVDSWVHWIDEINNAKGIVTSVGEMMGDHSSFPVMAMVSFAAMDSAGLVDGESCGDDLNVPMGKTNWKPPVILTRGKARTVADERILNEIATSLGKPVGSLVNSDFTPVIRRKVHDETLAQLGAVLSTGDPARNKPNKVFFHPTRSIFCEIPETSGYKQPRLVTSLLAAPPGGSKGSLDWFNQPSALHEAARTRNFRIPKEWWARLPHWQTTCAARRLGVPVREPQMMGGILHPLFPHGSFGTHDAGYSKKRGKRDHIPSHQAWLNCLTSIRVVDWATGTGLSPIPPAGSALTRNMSKMWLETELKADRKRRSGGGGGAILPDPLNFEGQVLPSIADMADKVSTAASSYALYLPEKPGDVFLKTPSVEVVAEKFHRRIRRDSRAILNRSGAPMELNHSNHYGLKGHRSYGRVRKDIDRKVKLYFNESEDILPLLRVPRLFGLEPHKPSPKMDNGWMWPDGRVINTDAFVRLGMGG